ncbi:hypothetical protein V8B55DRAFT_1538895 [Mucor lusitanicus]|uniref:PAS domain-containing protein n=1 Tax=Mucor lusitanicus CBS 277.49 TaxID=747725 RepID=A0A168N7F6_MUCCL|nr:hypothetical protein MUCCIDRAFT_159595 [Mucor lusitanicus CBS 277.49]
MLHQQDQHSHSTTNCPLRSMAWITVEDEQTTVTHATAEIISLLGFNPVGQSLHDIWQPLQEDMSSSATTRLVSTANDKVLEICQHAGSDKASAKATSTIICTDMTELNHMYTTSRQKYSQVAITRLTMYGTIDAVFQSDEQNTTLAVGQPMMRYIHSDDVQQFCAGLKQATKYNAIATFCVRFIDDETFEFTVMAMEGGKVLCLMKPSSEQQQQQQHISCTNNSVLRNSVTRIQHRFWYAVEHGMTFIARNLANSLIMMIQTVWCFWHDNNNNNKACTWSGLFSTSSEYLVKKLVSTTKERPEIDTLCHWVSYVGISKTASRSWFDFTLDATSEWLIQKALTNTDYNESVDSLI